jgi:hypothetical protein
VHHISSLTVGFIVVVVVIVIVVAVRLRAAAYRRKAIVDVLAVVGLAVFIGYIIMQTF